MKISVHYLEKHLNKTYPVTLLSGDEPYFIQDAIKKISLAQKQNEEEEITRFYIENKSFSFEPLVLHAEHPSLFNDTKWIYIKLSTSLDKKMSIKLLDVLQKAVDSIFIIETPKLNQSTLKQGWVKWIEKAGLHIEVKPLNHHECVAWTRQKMKDFGLSTSEEGYQKIALSAEGNMLALSQTIEKLCLIYESGQIDDNELENCLSTQSHYTIFQCIDEALNQNNIRMLNIFNRLKTAKTEPTLLLWALLKELRTLTVILYELEKGQSLSSLFQKYRIWESKKQGVSLSLKSHNIKQLYSLFKQAKSLDEQIKGLKEGDIWLHLKKLICSIACPENAKNTIS
jgi:DNA polymerase-3 subunit delta